MKWLNFENTEKRDKVLTIRTTESCIKKIKGIIKTVEKYQKHQISQADLLERLIDEAWSEAEKLKKPK